MEDQEKDIAYELAKEIHHSLSGKEDGKTDLELLQVIKQLKNKANHYLERIGTSTLFSTFEKVKLTSNQVLLNQITHDYSFIKSDPQTVAECIKKIHQFDLGKLPNLSYGKDNLFIALLLALIIEAAKTEARNNKIPTQIKKEIFIFMIANEIKSILKELKTGLLTGQGSYSRLDIIMDLSEHMYRLGYLSGLLDSEKKFETYHHSLVSGKHCQAGQRPKQDFVNEIQTKIKKYAQKRYDAGCQKRHEQVAEEIRPVVFDFISRKKQGLSFDIEKLDPWFQDFIKKIENYHNRRKDIEHLENIFKKRRRNDIFFEPVKAVCPGHLVRGRKKQKK